MHGAAATDEHVAGKIGDDADASLQNENKCVGGDGEGVPDVLNNTKHKGVVGNDEAEPDKSVGDEPNGAGEVVPSANATQQSGIDKKKRSTRKRLKQAVARVADHETAHEQPVWLLQSDDNIDGSDFAWVEWGNGQKQLIPKSRISSEEVEEISSQPRRTRGSREGAHKGNKGAPKEKRARSVRGRKRAKRVSSSNNSPSSLSSHSEGTSVDHSSLSTGSRVLVVSKGSQFKATIRKRRHENNRHEFLIHYEAIRKQLCIGYSWRGSVTYWMMTMLLLSGMMPNSKKKMLIAVMMHPDFPLAPPFPKCFMMNTRAKSAHSLEK